MASYHNLIYLHNIFNTMAKVKYYYDTKTLNYQRIEKTPLKRVMNILIFLGASAFTGILMIILFYPLFGSPKEKMLSREISVLKSQYNILNEDLRDINLVLQDMEIRDDNIYRVIFEADPIPSSVRKAGFGGVNRYQHLENMTNSELMINTSKKIDQISKQIYIQSKSFDEVIEMAKDKSEMLASIPSIQPVSNKDLTRMVSGYGMRTHPIYKIQEIHEGMDFAAEIGTPIYATGNGRIEKIGWDRGGYGHHVIINHGYGYKTLYAHMNDISVKKGQKVNRGEVIGSVGNTGLSVGPHLHYEVHYNGKKENPSFFYHNDLTPEEYNQLIELASKPNQSLD